MESDGLVQNDRITMNRELQKEIKKLIKTCELNCTIDKFKDKVSWNYISISQKLSEDFIREFKDKINWYYISFSQKLSEKLIREFKDKVDWHNISYNQKLSENFIREFKDNFKEVTRHYMYDKKKLKRIKTIIQKYDQEEQNKAEKENQILRKKLFKGNAILMLEI